MSYQVSSLGTTDATYAYNKDRSGEWSHYLQTLSQSNNHDRQLANGELNSKVGIVPIGTDIKKIRTHRTKFRGGGPSETEINLLKKAGYLNPRYQYHGDA